MKRLEYVDELLPGKAVEMAHQSVNFGQHLLPILRDDRDGKVNTYLFCPLSVSIVNRGKATGEVHDPSASPIGGLGARDCEAVEHVVIEVHFDHPSHLPVNRRAA